MKTYTVGIVAVAILVVVTGIGFGIAQAGGTHSERPILSFADMEALEQGGTSSSYVETRPVLAFEDSSSRYVLELPSAIDVDYRADGNPSSDVAQAWRPIESASLSAGYVDFDPFSRAEHMQLESPIETGAIPATLSEEPWMKGYGHD